MRKTHTIARAIGQSPRKQAEFAKKRAEQTKELEIDTTTKRGRPPKPRPPKKKDVQGLKNRAESIEGSEMPQVEFAEETAGMPKEGFNGN